MTARYTSGQSLRLRAFAAFLSGLAIAAAMAVIGMAALLPAGPAAGQSGPVIQLPTETPTTRATRTPTPRKPRLPPTPVPTPTPAVFRRVAPGISNETFPSPTQRPVQDMAPLKSALQRAVDAFPVSGSYAVTVTDLQTGVSVDVNGDSYQLSGCIVNIFVLMSAMLDVQSGAYSLDDVSGLIAATLWSSNTATARSLYRKTGGGDQYAGVVKVGRLMNEKLGMEGTLIDHPPGYPWETLGRDPNNWISSNDVNRGLAKLWGGGILHDPYRVYLLDAMQEVMPSLNYILAYNPRGRVSHKNGWLFEDGGWVDNDAGIVRFTRNGTEYAYAFTFMSQDVARFKAEVPLGQQLARIAWDWFDAAYP